MYLLYQEGFRQRQRSYFYVSCDAFKIGVVSLFKCQKFWWSKDWGWHTQKSGKSLEAGSPIELTHPVGILTSLGISYQLPSTGMTCGFCMSSPGTCCKTSLTTRLTTAASWNQAFSFYFIFQILYMCFLRGYSNPDWHEDGDSGCSPWHLLYKIKEIFEGW